MKRILIFLFTIISLLSFSQSEIWGVKWFAGIKDGGVLFSIDSSSSKINIEHRFQATTYDQANPQIKPVFDDELGVWFGIAGSSFFKYNPVNSALEKQVFGGLAYGEFSEKIGDYYYILHSKGVIKLDIASFQYKIIEGPKNKVKTKDAGLVLVEDVLYWAQNSIFNQVKICSLNINNDTIIVLPNNDTTESVSYPNGKLIHFNNKLYGCNNEFDFSHRALVIYSFDINESIFTRETSLESNKLSSTNKGLFFAADAKLYGMAPLLNNNSIEQMYCFNPETSDLEVLSDVDYQAGYNMFGEFYGSDSEGFLMTCENYGINMKGSIVKYLINEDRFEMVYALREELTITDIPSFNFRKDETLTGVFLFSGLAKTRELIQIDIANDTSQTITEIPSYNEYLEGYWPNDIIQLDNGMIIGTTDRGGNYTGSSYWYNSNGVLYQFNPITKEYKVLYDYNTDFKDYIGPGTISKLSNNHVLLKIANDSTGTIQLFDYNAVSMEMDSLGTCPHANNLFESDSTFVFWNNRIIERYNFLSRIRDTIYEFPRDLSLNGIVAFTDQKMVVQTGQKDSLGIRHTFIQNLDLDTQILQLKTELILPNEHEDGEQCQFKSYIMTVDSNLVGVVSEYVPDKENTTYLRISKYYLNNDSIQVLRRGHHYQHGFNIGYRYTYIDDYNLDGNVYALSMAGWLDFGKLTRFDFNNDTVIFCDDMELMTYDYEFEDGENGHRVLKKFKKANILSSYWTGINSSKWYDNLNWSNLKIPEAIAYITIDGYKPNYPIIDTLIMCGQLIIKPEGRILIKENGRLSIQNDLFNQGNLTIVSNDSLRGSLIFSNSLSENGFEKYIYQSKENIEKALASPVKLNSLNESDFYELYEYDFDYIWSPIETFPITPNTSEAYLYKSDRDVFNFVGQFNSGDQELLIPSLYQETLYPLPNPYPSSFNWNNANLANLSHKALYRFNTSDSSFKSYIDGMGDASFLVQPLDVFWVYSDGNEQMQLDNNARLHAANFIEYDIATKDKLVLQVSEANTSDQTYIRFNKDATANFDNEYDAFKIGGNKALQIFTFGEEETLSINQLPDTAMMDLSIKAKAESTYKINIQFHQGFDFVVLEDLIWNKRIDLLKEDYSFDYFTSDGNYPFKLYFKPWALEPVEEADIDIYYYPESIVIRSRKQVDEAEITFYDLAGRAVFEFSEQKFFHIEKPISLPVGHYIVQLRTGDLVINRKILVRR